MCAKDRKSKMPPVVPRGPTILRAAQFIRNPIPILDRHIEKYGDSYTFFMGGLRKSIVTANPGFIKHVLQKNHRSFEKSALQTDLLTQYIGHGLLTAKGEFWLRQRRMIQPGFHKERLKGLTKLMASEADEYLGRMAKKSDGSHPIDVYHEIYLLTFRIIAKTIFSQNLAEDKLEQLSNLISVVQSFIIREVRQPFLHWWFQISGLIKKHIKLAHQSFDIIGQLIDQRMADGERHDDLLDMLMQARYEDSGEGMTRQQLIEETLILFVAGHETSANALSWAMYMLAKHPAFKTDMKNEVDRVVGQEEISTDHLSELKFTKQIIEETLRMYPPAWVTDRVSLEAGRYTDFEYPKDTIFILYLWRLHRHPEYWKSPELFMPSRFAEENKKDFPSDAYKPFGGGPRLCIGNHFAMMEMQVILAELIRKMDWTLHREPIISPMITLRPKDGVWVNLRERNS